VIVLLYGLPCEFYQQISSPGILSLKMYNTTFSTPLQSTCQAISAGAGKRAGHRAEGQGGFGEDSVWEILQMRKSNSEMKMIAYYHSVNEWMN
jgi:hypothetical protein